MASATDRALFVIAMETVINSTEDQWDEPSKYWGYGFIICLSCGNVWKGIFPDETGGSGLPCSKCEEFSGMAVHG